MKRSRQLLAGFAALATFVAVPAAALVIPSVASAQEVRISIAPPAPQYEVIPVRPGPYHAWQVGSWVWHPEGRYLWHPGRWVVPPQGRTVWVRDEWVSFSGSWHYVPGHWAPPTERIVPALQRLTVTAPPPAEPAEVIEVLPPGHTWLKGHWSWDGVQYVWTPGHTQLVPVGFHTWEPGHWYATGPRWFFRTGYWH